MWVGNRAKTVRKLQLVTLDKNENLELTKNAQSRHVIERELCAARIFFIYDFYQTPFMGLINIFDFTQLFTNKSLHASGVALDFLPR